jgi:hypothetical protein
MYFNQIVLEALEKYHVVRDATEEDLQRIYGYGYRWVREEYIKGAWVVDDDGNRPGYWPRLVVRFKDNEKEGYTSYNIHDSGDVTFMGFSGLVPDAINDWEFRKLLSNDTKKTFGGLLDVL